MKSLTEGRDFREELTAEAERSVDLGDALDMKANVWLVVITFLGTQSVYFVEKGLPTWPHLAQATAILLLIVAAILTLVGLYPRDYLLFTPSNGAIESRLSQLSEFYSDAAEASTLIERQLIKDQIMWARERIETNHFLNKRKSGLLFWAFWFTALAAIMNLLTLLHFIKLPS